MNCKVLSCFKKIIHNFNKCSHFLFCSNFCSQKRFESPQNCTCFDKIFEFLKLVHKLANVCISQKLFTFVKNVEFFKFSSQMTKLFGTSVLVHYFEKNSGFQYPFIYVTSQIFNLGCYNMTSYSISYFIAFCFAIL